MKSLKALLILFLFFFLCVIVGCPQDRLKEGLSVVVKPDGVYFLFDRYDVLVIDVFTVIDNKTAFIYSKHIKTNEINKKNNTVSIKNQGQRWKHGSNFIYGNKYSYVIDTTGKSWRGYIQFDHKDPAMAGEDIDFNDTSKMKVTFIIDHFGKEVKRTEVKGSDYD